MKKVLLGLIIILVLVFVGKDKAGVPDASLSASPPSGEAVEEILTEIEVGEVVVDKNVREIVVEGRNFSFSPNKLTLKAGERIKLIFKSMGGTHDFVVEGLDIKTKRINGDESTTIEFTVPEKAGNYNFYCSVGAHRSLGMEGELVVE